MYTLKFHKTSFVSSLVATRGKERERERERERDRREAYRPIFEILVVNATFKTRTNLANNAACNNED